MFAKGVSRRWLVNTIGVVFLILVISITTISVMVQSSTYNGIELALTGRSDELLNWLSSSAALTSTSSGFTAVVRDYIEKFPDKNNMEIMALDQSGKVFITSTGFEPEQDQEMPDYEQALRSEYGSGKWVGHLNTGEKAMAITRVVRDDNGGLIGSVRYLVSMERADRQISLVIFILMAAGLFIMLLLTLSGAYFIRSILVPVRQLSQSARQIAQGDFAVRIDKAKDDEIGQLVDAINDMAGELGAAEQMKNDFISSVSHELRTPLTAMRGLIEPLRDGLVKDEEQRQHLYDIILRETMRLSRLVSDMLELSRLQSGTCSLEKRPFNPGRMLRSVFDAYAQYADDYGQTLRLHAPDALPDVLGNPDRTEQVLVAILDNAMKYTPEGGTIDLIAEPTPELLRVTVKDTGPGIAQADLPHVFERFYKADKAHQGKGTGLGLAIAHEIMKQLGEELTVQSVQGEGSAFTFTLHFCPQASDAHPKADEPASALPAGEPTIHS